jgi:hypothetical protein
MLGSCAVHSMPLEQIKNMNRDNPHRARKNAA